MKNFNETNNDINKIINEIVNGNSTLKMFSKETTTEITIDGKHTVVTTRTEHFTESGISIETTTTNERGRSVVYNSFLNEKAEADNEVYYSETTTYDAEGNESWRHVIDSDGGVDYVCYIVHNPDGSITHTTYDNIDDCIDREETTTNLCDNTELKTIRSRCDCCYDADVSDGEYKYEVHTSVTQKDDNGRTISVSESYPESTLTEVFAYYDNGNIREHKITQFYNDTFTGKTNVPDMVTKTYERSDTSYVETFSHFKMTNTNEFKLHYGHERTAYKVCDGWLINNKSMDFISDTVSYASTYWIGGVDVLDDFRITSAEIPFYINYCESDHYINVVANAKTDTMYMHLSKSIDVDDNFTMDEAHIRDIINTMFFDVSNVSRLEITDNNIKTVYGNNCEHGLLFDLM